MPTPLLLDVVDCSAQGAAGTGLAGCKRNRKRIDTIYLFPPDHIFDVAVIDKDYMQTQQTLGNLVVLEKVISFVDSTPADTIITRDGSGVKTLAGKLPYEYTATFDNGTNYQAALDSLSGNGNYSAVFGDVDGVLWLTKNKAGQVKPYTLGMHEVGNYLGEDGTNGASETFFMQLTQRKEVDKYMSSYKPADFDGGDIKGINDVTITIDPLAVGALALVFSPLLNDGTHMAGGLLVGDYVFKKNGVVYTPSSITADPATKKVTAVIPAATATTYTVEIDGIVLVVVADILYKTPEVATVLAA